MDLPHALQSIKQIEDDPDFQTESIDRTTFVPKYSTVIIVDPKAVDGIDLTEKEEVPHNLVPPGLAGTYFYKTNLSRKRFFNPKTSHVTREYVTNSLTGAYMKICFLDGGHDRELSISIILMAGLYADPRIFGGGQKKLNLEIVGLNDVRILFGKNSGQVDCCLPLGPTLTMRNIGLYDFRTHVQEPAEAFIEIMPNATVQLIGVTINVPSTALVMQAADPGSSLTMERCKLKNCGGEIKVMNGAKVIMKDCVLEDVGYLNGNSFHVDESASFFAGNTKFLRCNMFIVTRNGECSLTGCRVIGDITSPTPEAPPAFSGIREGRVVMEESRVDGYDKVMYLKGSGASLRINRCTLIPRSYVAQVTENSSFEVVKSMIECPLVAWIFSNVEGRIEIRENIFTLPPRIDIDQISKKPSTDVADISYRVGDPRVLMPSDKERSNFTKKGKMSGKASGPEIFGLEDKWEYLLTKRCSRCQNSEGNESYKYCAGCRRVCYCSKECQKKHWCDHKLSCAYYTAPRKDGE